MPNMTVYIRKDDVKTWLAFPNKAQAISELINGKPLNSLLDDNRGFSNIKKLVATPGQSFCKDGHAIPNGRDRCLGKGCKYA